MGDWGEHIVFHANFDCFVEGIRVSRTKHIWLINNEERIKEEVAREVAHIARLSWVKSCHIIDYYFDGLEEKEFTGVFVSENKKIYFSVYTHRNGERVDML